jgi:hypothetical protein
MENISWAQTTFRGVGIAHAGVNFDIEGNPSMADEMTAAFQSLRTAAARQNPHMQISFCHVVMAADPNLRRGYDVAALIHRKLVDFIVVMAYDMNWLRESCMLNGTECWDPTEEPGVGNAARANSPLHGVLASVVQYGSLGVQPAQLVYALPWYGYTSECANQTGWGQQGCAMPW